MGFSGLRRGHVVALGLFVLLAACQGNMGTTPPVTPAVGYTPGGQSALSALRGQSVSASSSATLAPDTAALTFPVVGGFGLVLQLQSPSPSPAASVPARGGAHRRRNASPSPSPSPSSSPSASPSPAPSLAPQGKKRHGGAAQAFPAGSSHLVDLTLTVYPDSAPDAPTAAPSTPPILIRQPLVRGDLHAQDAITLPSLSVISFTLAKREQVPGRGFTIAVFEQLKHRKSSQIAVDINASAGADGTVRSAITSAPVLLAANHRYEIVLYGEDLAPVRASAAPGGLPGPGGSPAPGSSPQPSMSPSSGLAPMGGTLIH